MDRKFRDRSEGFRERKFRNEGLGDRSSYLGVEV